MARRSISIFKMEMDRGKMILHFHQNRFLWENGNVEMEMNPFHNENEMSSTGRGPKMTLTK